LPELWEVVDLGGGSTPEEGHIMARGDQLARQWRIIQTLIASKHGKSVAELVKDEKCHPWTVYRDLEALHNGVAGGAHAQIAVLPRIQTLNDLPRTIR